MGDRGARPSFGVWESLMWTQRCKKEVDVILGGIPERDTRGGAPGQEKRCPSGGPGRQARFQQAGQRSVGQLQRAQSLDQISQGSRSTGGWGPGSEGPGSGAARRGRSWDAKPAPGNAAPGGVGFGADPDASFRSSFRSSSKRSSEGASSLGGNRSFDENPPRRSRAKDERGEKEQDYSDLPGNWPLHQGTMMTLRPNARVRTVLDQELVPGCNVSVKFEPIKVKYGVTDDMVYQRYVPKFKVTYRGKTERLGQRVY